MARADDPGFVEVRVERGDGVAVDRAAVEAPLEIRVEGRPLAVTLRTPGHDRELVAGFLYGEGLIEGPEHLAALEPASDPERAGKVFFVRLSERGRVERERLERARREFMALAACGLCGKRSLEDLEMSPPPITPLGLDLERVRPLPAKLRAAQVLFEATGGLHAAGLFDAAGRLLTAREDIGRHNAVDKVIGHHLLRGELPLAGRILASSGRAGFEIVQKALRAGIPAVAAVGAASSLAIDLALGAGMELFSFVGPGRGNRHLRVGA